MYGQQQQRPESERDLPQWELDRRDRQRMEERKNMAENPAIWQKLSDIEAKLDKILAALSLS